jgi:hypothetical protein
MKNDVFKTEREALAAKEALRAKFNELRIGYAKRGHLLVFCGRSFECTRCGCSGSVALDMTIRGERTGESTDCG